MFTLPPRPPRDYRLEEVTNSQASASELTPSAHPRATQTTIAKYCAPVVADDNEPVDLSRDIEKLNDRVLDRWTKSAKANWVDKPGLNDFFLHDLHRKYSVPKPELDERYKHRPKIFQRSYKYEFDCMEYSRLEKLRSRLDQEESLEAARKPKVITEEEDEVPERSTIDCCEDWKKFLMIPRESYRYGQMKRWQELPKLIEDDKSDLDSRRTEMARCGQPFKHEACLWYFKTYPPPNIQFIPEKFA